VSPDPADLTTAVRARLRELASPAEHAKVLTRVGDPDRVIGVRMKDVFDLAKQHASAPLDAVEQLLQQPEYECRMVAVSILDAKARSPRATPEERSDWCAVYLRQHDHIDLWDFVDRAAPRVVGGHLAHGGDRGLLRELAASPDPIRRRTAITATFLLVRGGELDDALEVAALLAGDPEKVVQANVGVALREVGRIDAARRDAFLADHPDLPRPVVRVARSG